MKSSGSNTTSVVPSAIRCLETVSDVALGGQRDALGGDGAPGNVSDQAFEGISGRCADRSACVQGESGGARDACVVLLSVRGQRLQGERFAPRMGAERDAVGDRMAGEKIHERVVAGLCRQMGGLGVAFDQPPVLEVTGDPLGDALDQGVKLYRAGRRDPAKVHVALGARDVHPVEREHMEMYVQIQGTPGPLDESDRPGVGRRSGAARLSVCT